jgi:hypothetical protein
MSFLIIAALLLPLGTTASPPPRGGVSDASVVTIRTPGLNIAFNKTNAKPVSVTNSRGAELLTPGTPQPGFYLMQPGNRTPTPFDTVAAVGANELLFSVAATGEEIGWAFSGAGHYVTANCTRAHGFDKGSAGNDGNYVVYLELEANGLHGIGLNFMVYDFTAEGVEQPHPGVRILYEAPWANPTSTYAKWNPPARFGVYEIVDDATEDETLFDFWVDEGLPRPRVPGVWDRPAAKAWLDAWIAAQYDMSNFAMVPHNLSEWRKFIPLAKEANAQVLWFNFRAWDWTSIDNVNPAMFPNGVADLKSFSDDAKKQGLRLSTHRMSGGLDPRDPDYCVKPAPGLLAWANTTLAAPAGASDRTITTSPPPGVAPPARGGVAESESEGRLEGQGGLSSTCSVGDEYIEFSNITTLPNGDWRMSLKGGITRSYAIGTRVRCYVKGNVYFLPDAMSDLYEEVAIRYANFSNLMGFQDGSFDGAGWFGWYGRWAFYKFATLVYENLDHPTAVHTSGDLVTPGWPEYRFNAVRTAFHGPFTTSPGGTPSGSAPMRIASAGHPQPGLEEVTNQVFGGLEGNTRDFTIGHDMFSTLEAYERIGNAGEILELVRAYKSGSFAMSEENRQHMVAASRFTEPRRKAKNTAKARWMVEGTVFRKWTNAGTSEYHTLSFAASSYVPSRFYVRSESTQTLVLPPGLWSGFDRAAVVGRLLPVFNATSAMNVDLLAKMKTGPTLRLSASNPGADDSWDEGRLTSYSVAPASAPLNFTRHQGVGLFVDGDGSGATLVVRFVSGTVARDYAVPLTFTDRQWIEIPAGEQGWSARNWGPTGKGAVVWVAMNYERITDVAVGVGYLPGHTTSNVTISGLQALSEIVASVVDPKITVGDQTIQAKGTLSTYDQFTLDHAGTFTIYDSAWHFISSCSVGAFRPTNLTSFAMASAVATTQPVWLEVGVSGSTETVPNPGYTA